MAELANSGVFIEQKITPEQKLWKAVLSQEFTKHILKKHKSSAFNFW